MDKQLRKLGFGKASGGRILTVSMDVFEEAVHRARYNYSNNLAITKKVLLCLNLGILTKNPF